ncbi:hypothetical protein G5I_02673 [Acromyrmex echinatior]|uniref:Uncharacterized protein n=1 Tax=Acromyrmex echinatior TaxID=103372 RepID=F4WAX8_ACREC|nr:hypothetical protein G5I_02673 [Acromyrmex echinatior]
MADKIVETVGDSAQCAAVSSSESKPSDLETRIDSLAADIVTLAAEVDLGEGIKIRKEIWDALQNWSNSKIFYKDLVKQSGRRGH